MWLGKEEEARAMTVPQRVFTVPSLLEFSSSIPFTAAEAASLSYTDKAAAGFGLEGVVGIV